MKAILETLRTCEVCIKIYKKNTHYKWLKCIFTSAAYLFLIILEQARMVFLTIYGILKVFIYALSTTKENYMICYFLHETKNEC